VPNYSQLSTILKSLSAPLSEFDVSQYLAPCLIHAWVTDYGRSTPDYDIIETSNDAGFSYLFDIQAQRLIAAWGLSTKKDTSSRDIIERRMRGHPLKNLVCGKRYHRGHAIPHTMGGRADINLVPQLGVINSGPFQRFEREAVATPGSLYLTYWSYPNAKTQRPSAAEQGLLVGGQEPKFAPFQN